jgi:dTMP kinase
MSQGGFFISFEGGEGVGKTTQIKALETHLTSHGHDVVITREPGGCRFAEDIRNLIFASKYSDKLEAETETLLMFAARAQHIKEVIAPAIESNKIVLCDRYMDSTRVYQGMVNNVDLSLIQTLEDKIVRQFIPNLTLILDLDIETAMARVSARGASNHYDLGDEEFYHSLRNGFLSIAKENPSRCKLVDANRDIETTSQSIQALVSEALASHV